MTIHGIDHPWLTLAFGVPLLIVWVVGIRSALSTGQTRTSRGARIAYRDKNKKMFWFHIITLYMLCSISALSIAGATSTLLYDLACAIAG